MLTGKDLVKLGYQGGRWFKEALDYINANNITGSDLDKYMETFKVHTIAPYDEALPYFRNIEGTSEAELLNMEYVYESMDEIMRLPTAVTGAVMPDACPTADKQIPVGGVAVTRNAIHPSMHSADICCSVMITGFGSIDPKRILDLVHKITDFGSGPRKTNIKFELPTDLGNRMADNQYYSPVALGMAKSHLGSQGDGNHFAFVGTSKNTGETCLVTHHGSRGVGAQVYKYGMNMTKKWAYLSPATNPKNGWIPFTTPEGQEYWEALQMVREWTKLNHEVLHQYVVDKVKYVSKLHFWNEHNFVFKRDDLFYHAKGATPLEDDFVPDNKTGLRLVPMNMKDGVLIVRGSRTENNLGFAPHGAGRNLSRTAHKKTKTGTIEEVFAEETNGLDVRFYTGKTDISELPSAYKSAAEVERQMNKFNLGEVVDRIIPYGCIMAGDAAWKGSFK